MIDYAPIDADGHVMETDDELRRYLPGELEERIIPYVIGLGLEKKLMYPSDYPHERPSLKEFLADLPRFRAREDLSADVKKLILRDNCIDFYSLKP